jgi:hypothetical protein
MPRRERHVKAEGSTSSPLERLGLVLVLLLTLTVSSGAHELGLTRVTVTFTADGRYQMDVLVDPESLLAKLEILAGQQPSIGVPLGELPRRITRLQEVALARTRLLFDGVRAEPSFQYLPGPPVAPGTPGVPAGTASTATMRFIGNVPSGARRFQINYGLVLGSYALTLAGASGGQRTTVWLAGGQESEAFDLRDGLVPASRLVTAREYFVLGFEHILPKGLDHILFVVGLFLLSASWRALFLQVTMFTVAHSLTLGLSMYGIVSLPSGVVEPLIALSICYVALENLFTTDLKPWRAGLVFLFGLLHGLGFAGVLNELGLPRSQFLTALVTFNVGVEAGQLAVIAIAFAVVGWWRRSQAVSYRRWVVVPASLAIAIVGAYWTVTRVVG